MAKELIYFNSYASLAKLAEIGYQVQLPYGTFWRGLANVVLLNYAEMEINHVIQILYYLGKMGHTQLSLDPALLDDKTQLKVEKLISKSAS